MPLFEQLDLYQDGAPHSAALNMAIDEALLELAEVPSIRFYRWDHPALSFGYFGRYADVAEHAAKRDVVRRWTGGGIVFHGEDLTYSIIIPGRNSLVTQSPLSIYAAIHGALRDALAASDHEAELAKARDAVRQLPDPRAAQRAVPTDVCFTAPVVADVMVNGLKVAGAAQRRTRRGLLQQGSIQQIKLAQDFIWRFAAGLCPNWHASQFDKPTTDRAEQVARQKYAVAEWLQRR